MQFEEVKSEDFVTFSRVQPAHVKIEQYLIERGGTGVRGAEFKKAALNTAGWNYGALVSYGAHPQAAAKAFNFIRTAAADDNLSSEELLSAIETQLEPQPDDKPKPH